MRSRKYSSLSVVIEVAEAEAEVAAEVAEAATARAGLVTSCFWFILEAKKNLSFFWLFGSIGDDTNKVVDVDPNVEVDVEVDVEAVVVLVLVVVDVVVDVVKAIVVDVKLVMTTRNVATTTTRKRGIDAIILR